MIKTSETQGQTEELELAAHSKKSSQTRITALAVFALGLNAAAAVFTMSPSEFALPNVSGLVAELLPHEQPSKPIPDAVVAALNDVQAAQQNNTTALQDHGTALKQNTALLQLDGSVLERNSALLQQNGSLLQENTTLLQRDSTTLDTLRSSLTDERSDVKTISTQLSTLIAKVDSLQNAMTSGITSSISKGPSRHRASVVARRHYARPIKPEGVISVGGAPFTMPSQSPEG